jgi:glutathionylspermidine amidase/synthetase
MSELEPGHIKHKQTAPPARFGTLLGYAPGNVPVYSSDYASADDEELPNRHAYRSYVDGVFMGYKWQCVEFARRWMYLNKGYIFDDVSMAYDIFLLQHVRVIKGDKPQKLPLKAFRNGSLRWPEPGCMLIWDEGGEFEVTGHVAIVTEVREDCIRFVEQNNHHQVWPEGQNYSRELKARIAEDGAYWIECSFGDAPLLGWMIQTDDERHAELPDNPKTSLYRFQLRAAEAEINPAQSWLNIANEDEAAFVKMMGGHRMTDIDNYYNKYLALSETAAKDLKRASNELHALFLHATDYVLQHEELLARFNLPRVLWSRIKQSWDNRRNEMITGRFDFCLHDGGIKVYEYNCDSASCYMECGKVQDKWSEHFDVTDGRSAGNKLHAELVEAWKSSSVKGVLHILQDKDLEETYHALFMKEAIEQAGIPTKILKDFSTLRWNDAGQIMDADGVEVRWVWKTWAWETALDQLREECEQDESRMDSYEFDRIRQGHPRLVDVLLRSEVVVFEPLWTLIPSNKAILAVLWSLFPDHPYLLETQFDLDDEMRHKGFAEKPIAGRCGHNISLVEKDTVLESSSGKFQHQDVIYQELCMLPSINELNIQLCSFTVDGSYAGACTRTDSSVLITKDSDLLPLRILDDEEFPD